MTKPTTFEFDENYKKYWEERVKNATDGTKSPDEKIISFFVEKMKMKTFSRVLDVGCGHGRCFEILNRSTSQVYGLDANKAALVEARKKQYLKLVEASAEETTFPNGFFDHVFALAIFDILSQDKALIEWSRILKVGGTVLVTGKSDNYDENDDRAVNAEIQAKRKNFPNRFTNVSYLFKNLRRFGFELLQGYGFRRRGDFGENQYFELHVDTNEPFYEYLLILEKISESIDGTKPAFSTECSQTVLRKLKLSSLEEFTNWVRHATSSEGKQKQPQ